MLQPFPKESTWGPQRTWKTSLLQPFCRLHLFVLSCLWFSEAFEVAETRGSCLWVPGNIFLLSSSLLVASPAAPTFSHAVVPTLPWAPLLPHTEFSHPCSICCFLGRPPPCSYKARKVGPGAPLCSRQVLVRTIPKYLRDSRMESSALMDEPQSRGFKANSRPALGTQRACLAKGCSSQHSQGAHIAPILRRELLLHWAE